MWVVVILLIIIGGLFLLASTSNHRGNVEKAEGRKIKFSDWSTWYFLNEDVWQKHYLYDGIVSRKDLDIWYCFNFIDEFKFRHFMNTIKKKKVQKEQNKDIIKLLEKVQKDIEDVKEKSNKEINQTRNEINAFCRRSKKDERKEFKRTN